MEQRKRTINVFDCLNADRVTQSETYQVGQYLEVFLYAENGACRSYRGIIQDCIDGEWEIRFMEKKGDAYVWPVKDDVSLVPGNGERNAPSKKSFCRETYWSSVDSIFKMLSVETTKISLAFSKEPFPSVKNTETMVTELEKRVLTLVSLYYSLPISEGSTLVSFYQKAVLQVLSCLAGFASSVSEVISSERHSDRLQWTGGVWEASGFHLPKDNKQCTLKSLAHTAELVQDALGEIQEAGETDGCAEDLSEDPDHQHDEGITWSDQDRLVVSASEGLVKTTKAILKKAQESIEKRGSIDSELAISTLDDFVSLTSTISSSVDDFICCIYAPINYTALHNNGKLLSEVNIKCLQFLRDSDLTNNQDIKWLDFLMQAVSHNLQKLEEKVQSNSDQG
ncbi:cyclin-d1-binding protein 1 [Plakobranchus ocellatus]|uniref:Cyclin-d1-binding protein 1 n=1 Tax=Plakobranchus ocellatus TaxID=259542 RepID=A0AAV4ASJ4_9GAST|nr:cyclin-d1-binding protein 1 [Plakobranchus ocellatus]